MQIHPLEPIFDNLRKFLAKDSIRESDVPFIRMALDHLPFFSAPVFELELTNIQRVTINNRIFKGEDKRITSIKNLIYPPREMENTMGRANFTGQSVFYGAFDPHTVMSEMQPSFGDRVTFSKWKLNEGQTLKLCPVFKHTSGNGGLSHNQLSFNFMVDYENLLRRMDKTRAQNIDMVVSFIADCFAKEVDQTNPFDYYLSAYFANLMLYEFEAGEIDAIIYPSVKGKLSFSNIAIKPDAFDSKYSLAEVTESFVMSDIKENEHQFMLHGTASNHSFNDDEIIWRE